MFVARLLNSVNYRQKIRRIPNSEFLINAGITRLFKIFNFRAVKFGENAAKMRQKMR